MLGAARIWKQFTWSACLPLYPAFPGPGCILKRVPPLENSSPKSCVLLCLFTLKWCFLLLLKHTCTFLTFPQVRPMLLTHRSLWMGGFIPYALNRWYFPKSTVFEKETMHIMSDGDTKAKRKGHCHNPQTTSGIYRLAVPEATHSLWPHRINSLPKPRCVCSRLLPLWDEYRSEFQAGIK